MLFVLQDVYAFLSVLGFNRLGRHSDLQSLTLHDFHFIFTFECRKKYAVSWRVNEMTREVIGFTLFMDKQVFMFSPDRKQEECHV
jgi:hypothetical protein